MTVRISGECLFANPDEGRTANKFARKRSMNE